MLRERSLRMGFSTDIQNSSTHSAFISRQDAELLLVEVIRKCTIARIKCDREYSIALGNVVTIAQKSEPNEVMSGSLIAQAWHKMIDQTNQLCQLAKRNCDILSAGMLERINTLLTEKRQIRKMYQDECDHLNAGFTEFQDSVSRMRNEYQKCADGYKIAKTKYDDVCAKGSTKQGSRKLDESKEKYQKCCKKFHQIHNDYVLLLQEATEYERDMQNVIMPNLLKHVQEMQEQVNEKWKDVLLDMNKNTSMSVDSTVENAVMGAIKDLKPQQEYATFFEKHRSVPQNVSSFTFDISLTEEVSDKVHPQKIIVNDLTIANLNTHQNELQKKIKCIEEKQRNIVEDRETERNSFTNISIKGSAVVDQKVKELECQIARLKNQYNLIKESLDVIGCEEPPIGCDFKKEDPPLDNDQSDRKSKQAQGLAGMFRIPFGKNKGTPTSPLLPRVRNGSNRELSSPKEEIQPWDSCIPPLQNQTPLTPTITNIESLSPSPLLSPTPPSVPYNTSTVEKEEWFHGVLPREEVVRLLRNKGDFLVRETIRNEEQQIVLSVNWEGHRHFIVQTSPEGLYRFEGPMFPSIKELIMFQYENKAPVTNRSRAILETPILRERWELNNDDIELINKLGKGNFGDVYKARLRPSLLEVAVKTCKVTLPDEHKKKFLQEGRILQQYDHPNIVKFIGIAVRKQPIMIVMELVPGGSLITFLKNNKTSLRIHQLIGMCRDAAAGMQYLELKNCIHRDLAARNCLIGTNNVVKISDFGMSREVEEEYTVSDGMKQIPIKWTAPEALHYGKYTSLCDVWSYGVLVWEIFSKGETPYQGLTNTQAREQIDKGYRMSAPEGTPEEMRLLLLRCWEYLPDDRPHFQEIFNIVDALKY